MSIKEGNKRINVTFTPDDYEAIRLISAKENISMSELVRDYCIQGINGKLTKDNLEVLVPVIRDQLKSILNPSVDRLATLSAKTCVQAGAAAYLSAEALSKFVPDNVAEDFTTAYEKARKKAVIYMKQGLTTDEF